MAFLGYKTMSIKSRVDKIENQLNLSNMRDISDADLEQCFPGWTKEELINYAISGVKPDKPVGHISDRLREHINNLFLGWTNEDLYRYATTGIKPNFAKK